MPLMQPIFVVDELASYATCSKSPNPSLWGIFGVKSLQYSMILPPSDQKHYFAISFLYKLLKQRHRGAKGKLKRQLPIHQKPQCGIGRLNKERDRNLTECYNSNAKMSPRHLLFNHALRYAICHATRFLLIIPFIGMERRTSRLRPAGIQLNLKAFLFAYGVC